MAFCSQCGQQLATGDEFCGGCGQRIAEATGAGLTKPVETLPKKRVITPARAVIGLVLVGVLLFGGLSIAAFFARGGFCFTKCAKQCDGATSLLHSDAEERCKRRCRSCCTSDLPPGYVCYSDSDGDGSPVEEQAAETSNRGLTQKDVAPNLRRPLNDEGITEPLAAIHRAEKLALSDPAAAVKALKELQAEHGDRNCGSEEWEESCKDVAGEALRRIECAGKEPAGAISRDLLLESLNSAIQSRDTEKAQALIGCMFTIGVFETDFVWPANGRGFANNLVREGSKDNWVFVAEGDGFRVKGKFHYARLWEKDGRHYVVGFVASDEAVAKKLTPGTGNPGDAAADAADKREEETSDVAERALKPHGAVEWVEISGGETVVGCEHARYRCNGRYSTFRRVDVPAFKILRTEVTKFQYGKCIAARKCRRKEGDCDASHKECVDICALGSNSKVEIAACGERCETESPPISSVTAEEAQAFCKWIGGTLPTEVQWERAARGSDGRLFPWGDSCRSCIQTIGQGDDPTGAFGFGPGCGRGRPWPVGSIRAGASPEGVLDLDGNVSEWTFDTLVDDPNGPPWDGAVAKGGNWRHACKPAFHRIEQSPTIPHPLIGFRCVKTVR